MNVFFVHISQLRFFHENMLRFVLSNHLNFVHNMFFSQEVISFIFLALFLHTRFFADARQTRNSHLKIIVDHKKIPELFHISQDK